MYDSVVSITATDNSGNSSNCSFTLSLLDTISPTISFPSSITEYYDSNCEFILNDYTSLTTFFDNCDPYITLNHSFHCQVLFYPFRYAYNDYCLRCFR